jgi:tRNA(Ile)-lysidine synthase
MSTLNKIKSTIKKYRLFQAGDRIIVGVSGGPDSLALLFILNSLKNEHGLSLCVAHLNHGLRKDAKEDLLFVKNISRKLNLPFMCGEVNINKLAKKGSIEEVAREERLRFLFKSAKKFKADKIALGHTKDDQAETVLMRMLRGTGLYGLRGILPKREIGGFTIVRPLIGLDRNNINEYLKAIKVKPRIDCSNFDDIYFRNKIRNRLLPLLAKNYNRNIKEILSDMAENAGLDYDYLFNAASLSMKQLGIRRRSGNLMFNIDKFKKFHLAIQRMILRSLLHNLIGSTRKLNFKHWKELEDLILNRPFGSVVDLPHQIKASKNKNQIIISLRNA